MALSSWAETEEGISVYFVVFSSLLALVLVLSKVLHDHEVVASVLPEAGMILLVGIIVGTVVYWIAGEPANEEGEEDNMIQSLVSFSPKIFFVALLPPIIFNSGYHLRRELFFRHFAPICLFACMANTDAMPSITPVLCNS